MPKVMPTCPALAEQYPMRYGRPRRPADEMLTIAARLDHFGHREADAHVGGREAGIDGVEPVLLGVFLHRLGDPAVAGIVHQGIDLAEGFHALRDHPPDVQLLGGVAGDRDGAPAVLLHQRRRLFHEGARARRAHHRRALAREETAHDTPDAFAGSRDDRDLAGEEIHGRPFRAGRV
jgi:hypothetical protein